MFKFIQKGILNQKFYFHKIVNYTSKKHNPILKIYNDDFVYNLFADKKVVKFLTMNYNIDKCLLNEQTINNVY
jgi:uncharacterized protein (UPF0332 family)